MATKQAPTRRRNPYALSPQYIGKMLHNAYDAPETLMGELGIWAPGATPEEISKGTFKLVAQIEAALKAHGETAAEFEKRTGHLGSTKQFQEIQATLGKSPARAAGEAIVNAPGEALKFFNFPNLEAFFGAMGSAQFWIRFGEAIGGVILLYIALKGLTGTGASDLPGAKAARRVVPGA